MDLTHEQKRSNVLRSYLQDVGLEGEKLKQRLRAIRAASLPEEDRGLIYWEVSMQHYFLSAPEMQCSH